MTRYVVSVKRGGITNKSQIGSIATITRRHGVRSSLIPVTRPSSERRMPEMSDCLKPTHQNYKTSQYPS